MTTISQRARATITAIALGTLVMGITPALAGTSIAEIDILNVSFTDTDQLLVEGSVRCASGSTSSDSWMTVLQTLDGGDTYLYSEQRDIDEQVVCDGSTHSWQVLFDSPNLQLFEQDQPLTVNGQLPLADPDPARPGYLLDFVEKFVVTGPTTSREPVKIDVTDVRYTATSAVVVEATIKCPTGYAPDHRPEIGYPATRMQLEQWYVTHHNGGTQVFSRSSEPKSFTDQVVCDGTAQAVSLRFGHREDDRSFRARLPIRVSMEVNVAKGDSRIRAVRQEEFLGV